MLKFKKTLAATFLLLVIFIFSATLVFAIPTAEPTGGLVPCGTVEENGIIKNPCTFNDLFTLINKLMNYALWLVTAVLVGVVAYAGYKYIMSRGNPGQVKETNKMFWLIIKGLIWMLCAWLLVRLISTTFLNDGYDAFLKQ